MLTFLMIACIHQELARKFALSVGVDTMKSQSRECVVTLHRFVVSTGQFFNIRARFLFPSLQGETGDN